MVIGMTDPREFNRLADELDRVISQNAQDAYVLVRASDALRTAAAGASAGAVKVKPLEWVEREGVTGTFDASTPVGHYIATITDDDRGMWFIVGQTMGAYMLPDIDVVKAAAQADYEQRILSALIPEPAKAGDAVLREALDLLQQRQEMLAKCANDPKYSDQQQEIWAALANEKIDDIRALKALSTAQPDTAAQGGKQSDGGGAITAAQMDAIEQAAIAGKPLAGLPSDTAPAEPVSVEELRDFIYVRQPCYSKDLAHALLDRFSVTTKAPPRSVDIEAIARVIDPGAFDDDYHKRHRHCSPLRVDVVQERALAKARSIAAMIEGE